MKVAAAVCGRAFALEGRGIWHALSVSAAQQVYGPVRARADLRFALESPPAAPSEDPGRATLEGAWKVGLGRGYSKKCQGCPRSVARKIHSYAPKCPKS
jgi:hypothetical protein